MDTRKKAVQQKTLEKREQGFNVYVSGANAVRVDDLRKKEKHEMAQHRSKSKNTRKKWDVEGDERPKHTEDDDEDRPKKEVTEAPVKRERRGWGVPRPDPVFEGEENKLEKLVSPKRDIQEDIPDYSDKSQEVESKEDVDNNKGEEEENEDIKNFISSMKSGDIEKLRQSVVDSLKEEEFRKTLQSLKAEQPQISNEKPAAKNKRNSDEVEEEIAEDIEENPVELDQDYNKSTNRVESSYYAGRPISVRKARPISATYHDISGSKPVEPVYAGIPFQTKNIAEPSFELDYRKTVDHPPQQSRQSTNPFKAPISPTNKRPNMKEKNSNTEIPSKGPSAIIKSTKTVATEESVIKSPVKEEGERKSAKGENSLLKRIESLDEKKKQLLENILDKIEKGEYNKEMLLNLDFLNIKSEVSPQKSPQKEVRRSRELKEKEPREQKEQQREQQQREQQREQQRRDSRDKKDRHKHVPTKSELTLPSNVESKISKFIENSPLLEKKSGSKITDLPKIESKAAPLKTEEAIHEKISLPKTINETPKISTTDNSGKSSSRNNLQDSLEQNTFAKRASNGANYYSNPEPVHLPGLTSKSKNQASANLKTEPPVYPELKIGETTSQSQDHQLQFRIMSTWGSISQAGLTDIQLFDEEGKRIEVKPSDFHLKNCGLSSIKTINRLVDGVIYTTEDEHMWLCSMPAPPMTAEMFITLKNVKGVGAFRIWNYNKSLIDSIKGIKKLEIIHNKNLVWIGNVNRGPGNEFETYHTEIILKQGITLPPVEQPQILNTPVETTEPEKPKESDVPIWLQDTWKGGMPPVASSFESRGSVGTGLSRREHERSASALTSGPYLGLEPTKSLADKVHNTGAQDLKLPEVVKSATTTDAGKGIDVNKSASRIRNQPRSEGPVVKDVFDQNPVLPSRRTEEKTPRASLANDQKENTNVQSSGKKDDNSSINSVEFFNITNFGRLRPAKRESLMQVFNLQQDVIQKVQDVQKRLDFKTTPITEEMDILTQFDKGGKEDQPKLKIPQQSVEQASVNLGKKKEEAGGLTRKTPSIQSKTAVPDALDSLFNKGSATSKNATSNVEMETPATTKKIEKILYENRSFRIPELPKGRVIKICIYSTWGDAHYVGLNGIELFDDRGDAITLQDVNSQIKANPPDINCLPGYGKDPRTIDKIVDGTYLTCDDLHVWLAPFNQGKENTIEIDFRETRTISMIRIWNYNKSRIHSYRGARDIAIKLDETPIFLGEISKAPGSLKGAEDSCEYILFTENDNILSKIENRDWLNRVPKNENIKPDLNSTIERPMTGTRQFDESDLRDIKDAFNQPLLGPDGRPMTMARINVNNQIRDQIEKNKKELKRLEQQEKLRQEKEKANISKALSIISSSSAQYAEIKCKSLVITITKSWGDPFYVGLTGLEVYDGEGNKIILSMKNLSAKPKDMNSIPGYSGDHRTLDKLINHDNLTVKDENMWLIPFTPNQNHYIYINFDEAKTVSGIKFWNYNKGEDGSYRGSKYINISADGIMLTPPSGVLLRKAPGNDYHDYSQFVPVPFFDGWDEETVKLYKNMRPQPMSGFLTQEYDTPEFPTGFCFKLKLLSTWGDFNYIGLNGIEFYDQKGEVVLTKAQKDYKLSAEPSSVSCLTGHEDDIRTIDKLVNGNNNTFDDRNMWLAPLLLDRRDEGVFKVDHNEIVFAFDKPKIISCIKFWNYSKTPIRGVREVEIFCDDVVIYRGYLRMATSEAESKNNMNLTTAVLFTKNSDIIQKVDANIYTEDGKPQKVTLYNEKKVKNFPLKISFSPPKLINPVNESRPQTHATLERPTTSVKGLMPY